MKFEFFDEYKTKTYEPGDVISYGLDAETSCHYLITKSGDLYFLSNLDGQGVYGGEKDIFKYIDVFSHTFGKSKPDIHIKHSNMRLIGIKESK